MSDHTAETGVADAEAAAAFLTAYGAHDWQAVRDLLLDDATWELPGRAVISGTARGKDAIVERVQHIVASGVQTEFVDIRLGQSGVALNLRNTATSADGRVLDERLITLLRLDGSRIAGIETYLSDVPMMEAFFGLAD